MYMQGKALPLSVFGLLQHETKLSVVNFSVRKASSFEDPVPNKAELLLLTGIRSAWALLHFVTHNVLLHCRVPSCKSHSEDGCCQTLSHSLAFLSLPAG